MRPRLLSGTRDGDMALRALGLGLTRAILNLCIAALRSISYNLQVNLYRGSAK